MKLIVTCCVFLMSFIGFTQDKTENSKANSEACTTNYFTQKDSIQMKFENVFPQSELLAMDIEICELDHNKVEVFKKFNPEFMAAIYILKNSSKLRRN